MKKHETLTTIPPIRVYINRINNRLVFKIKDGYKLKLDTNALKYEIIWKHKKFNKRCKKNGENLPSHEVIEVVLFQCNIVDKQYTLLRLINLVPIS